MDKKIIETLIKFGLITNIGVNPDSYTDIDDLINKGVITIPGAKERIKELIKDISIEPVESVEDTDNTVIVNEDIKETVENTVEPVKTETSAKRSKKQNKTE